MSLPEITIFVDERISGALFSGIQLGAANTFGWLPKPWAAWKCADVATQVEVSDPFIGGFKIQSRKEGMRLVEGRGVEIPLRPNGELKYLAENRVDFRLIDPDSVRLPFWIASQQCDLQLQGVKTVFISDKRFVRELPNFQSHFSRVSAALNEVKRRFPVPGVVTENRRQVPGAWERLRESATILYSGLNLNIEIEVGDGWIPSILRLNHQQSDVEQKLAFAATLFIPEGLQRVQQIARIRQRVCWVAEGRKQELADSLGIIKLGAHAVKKLI